MSWKDRAIVEQSTGGATGSWEPSGWRDRALAEDDMEPSIPGVIGRGVAQGISFGFADEAMAGLQAPFSDKTYQELRDIKRQQLEADRAAYPKTQLASEVGGAILPVVAAEVLSGGTATPGVAATQAGNVARIARIAKPFLSPTTLKGLAASGAAYGLGKSEADLTKGEVGPAAMDTGKSALFLAALGKAIPPVAEYGGKALTSMGKALGEGGEFLASKAVGLTKGLRKRLDISPAEARGVGREALESGVVSPFADAEEMARRAMDVKGTVGREIRETVQEAEALGGAPNMTDLIAKLEEKAQKYADSEVTQGLYNQFKSVIADLRKKSGMIDIPGGRAYQGGAVTPTGLQEYKEILGDVAFPKGVATESKIGLQKSYTPIKEELETTVEEAVSPQKRQVYEYLKKRYGKQDIIETGLTERLASEEGNRFIRPTDFLVGGAFGLGGGIIPGVASVVAKRGIEKYGHQVGAVTMDRIGKILAATPQAFGPYSTILQQAMSRGGNSFAITNFLMQQRDAGYREMMEKVSSDDSQNGGEGIANAQ